MRRFSGLVILLVLLGACSDPPPKQGYVQNKEFTAAHWEGGWETHTRMAYKCETTSDYDPATKRSSTHQSCGMKPDTYQEWESHHNFLSDQWRLQLEECKTTDKGKRKCHTGWLAVDETTYHDFRIGQHYPNPT